MYFLPVNECLRWFIEVCEVRFHISFDSILTFVQV